MTKGPIGFVVDLTLDRAKAFAFAFQTFDAFFLLKVNAASAAMLWYTRAQPCGYPLKKNLRIRSKSELHH
jgi:hypothetical protein